jgi:hypothetical protein
MPKPIRMFFLGILGFFELVKFGFISSPQSLCDIDTQKLVKISNKMSFVDFSSYEKRGENPE